MSKRGRPHSDNPKYYQYRLRMTAGDKNKLERICKTSGMNKADVLRTAVDKLYAEEMINEGEK